MTSGTSTIKRESSSKSLGGSASRRRPIRVLVVGDAMIDRSWIVAEAAGTSQAHAEIRPRKVVSPDEFNTRPGGAGLTAALVATDARVAVTLVGDAGAELAPLLTDENVGYLPGSFSESRQTTTKFRIYADRGPGLVPSIERRYDLDIQSRDFKLPRAVPRAEIVIIADFKKGVVSQELLAKLTHQQSEADWLVDSKSDDLLEHAWSRQLARPTLFVNRAEFSLLITRIVKDDSGPAAAIDATFEGGWYHVEPALLDAARRFHDAHPRWNLVVKLDAEGAVAFWSEGDTWKYAHARGRVFAGAVAIGAGDAFLAGWARALLDRADLPGRLARGVQYATAWVENTERTRELVRPSKMAWPTPVPDKPPVAVVKTRIKELVAERKLEGHITNRQIDLANAGGHCGQFMTLNPAVAIAVRQFAGQINAYFASAGLRRPLNCAVWAAPGSGKSFLVEEVASEVGARFHEINVSTLSTRADLSRELEEVRNLDDAKILVMIDECMTQIGNAHVISALIGPLWRKSKTKKIAFVLVDSLPLVKSVDEFLEHMRTKVEKGPDLVSRINGPAITLAAPSPLDRAILICSLIRRAHKKSAFAIEEGALQALVAKTSANWSPRAVEYVVEALEPMGGIVRLGDLRRVEELCKRVGVELPQPHAAVASSVIGIKDVARR